MVVVVVVTGAAISGVVVSSLSTSCSLCHRRQLRFSNLRPCSTESAQRENTGEWCGQRRRPDKPRSKEGLPVHMLYRFAGLAVSTLWMTLASTVKTCVSNLYGMVL